MTDQTTEPDHDRTEPETTTHLDDGEDLEIAHPEDFGVARNDEGELETLKQRIPGTEKAVECKPLVDGAIDRWEHVLEGTNPDDDEVDEFLREHIETGIGSDGLNDVPDYVVPGLIEAVKRSSGYEVFSRIQEAEMEENLATIQAMDDVPDGLLDRVMGEVQEEQNGQPPTNGV